VDVSDLPVNILVGFVSQFLRRVDAWTVTMAIASFLASLMIMAAIEAVFFVGLFLLLYTTVRFTQYTRTAGDFSLLLLVL
jgi:hypothetical protein